MHLKWTMTVVIAGMLLIAGACGPANPKPPITTPPAPPNGDTPVTPAPNATPNVTSGGTPPPSIVVPAPPPAEVRGPNEVWAISGNSFQPGILTVSPGTTVVWTNKDSQLHTVVSNTGLFYGTLGPVESSNYTFTRIGDYEYNCDIHPGMAGAIHVR